MSFDANLPVIDLMINISGDDNSQWYDFMKPLLLDKQSREEFQMPAEYMFRNIPEIEKQDDYVAYTVAQMDKYNIQQAMTGIDDDRPLKIEAFRRFPQRFIFSYEANPNLGMEEVRKIKRLHQQYGIKAVTGFPSGLCPQVPINDKKWYPIYAACVELDIPICLCTGVPGPRLPLAPQKVELLDEVCWFFPELKVVMRHGAEPWQELACKLMLKYPNLSYMTSAFSPKYYPQAIIDFANTRGSSQIMYAGYFPMGLSLEKIFNELPSVPFNEEVWPKFLAENAKRVFSL